jgi:hypothetical protein
MFRFATLVAAYFMLTVLGGAKQLVQSERTAIFPAKSAENLIKTVCYGPPVVTGYWTPKVKDLEGVEDALIDYLRSEKVEEKKDWSEFRRQVVGVKRGEEMLLFIYYFHFDRGIEEDLKSRKTPGYDPGAWRKTPYVVNDGGSWFFRVLYDVKKKRFIWYESNGPA